MKRKIGFGDIWGLVYPMLIYTGISYLVSIVITVILSVIYFLNNPSLYTGNDISDYRAFEEAITILSAYVLQYAMHMTFIAGALAIPFMIFFMRRDVKKNKKLGMHKEYEKVPWYKYLLILPFSYFVMYFSNIVVIILEKFMPEFMKSSYDSMEIVMEESSFLIMFVTAGILAPIIEELIFRGLIYKRLTTMTSFWWSAIISAALFGIYHGNWIQAPYAFMLGLAMAYLYNKYQSIWAPIIFHMTANIYSVVISEIAKHIEQTEVTYSSLVEEISSYIPLLVGFAFLSVLFWKLIGKVVNAKEISNEVIDSGDSML